MVSLDGKDKMKIITKKKTYQFKFSDSESAKSWVSELNKIILKSVVSDWLEMFCLLFIWLYLIYM